MLRRHFLDPAEFRALIVPRPSRHPSVEPRVRANIAFDAAAEKGNEQDAYQAVRIEGTRVACAGSR